jgi:hypothetical protein
MGLWDRLHKDETPSRPVTVGEAIDLAQDVDARREVWGRPGRCPECGSAGYLDGVDLVNRIQYEKCPSCYHKWSVLESETVKL